MGKLILRPEFPAQYREMEEIVRDAFWDKYMPGCCEHLVVHNLRTSEEIVPELCLAAEENGELVGGIWYAKARIHSGEKVYPVLTMGPVCVKPEKQSGGIGSALIRKTLSLASEKHSAVIIYGNPGYYSRFGFRPSADFGITDAEGNPCPAILVYPIADDIPSGAFEEGPVYHVSREEILAFDRSFPHRRKHYRSNQLFFFLPEPPPESPLLFESWDIHRQAGKVLRDSKVLEAWESIGGKIRGVGSFCSGLMMKNRDIDLHIYTDTLDAERSLKALSSVIASPKTVKLTYINGSGTEEHCLEWHLHLLDEAGQGWKIDMIQILSGTKYDGFFEDVTEAVADSLTPETRERILSLKKECPDNMKICGIEYYKAVIADHVISWGEFMEWRKKNPPEKLLEWRPDSKKC